MAQADRPVSASHTGPAKPPQTIRLTPNALQAIRNDSIRPSPIRSWNSPWVETRQDGQAISCTPDCSTTTPLGRGPACRSNWPPVLTPLLRPAFVSRIWTQFGRVARSCRPGRTASIASPTCVLAKPPLALRAIDLKSSWRRGRRHAGDWHGIDCQSAGLSPYSVNGPAGRTQLVPDRDTCPVRPDR